MSDETHAQRLQAVIRKQMEAFENDPVAKAQAALDRWWQMQLDLRVALRSRPGDYDPMKRFELEQDAVQEWYDRRR
jgi:hypothetical protein